MRGHTRRVPSPADLTDAQARAVTHPAGAVLVLGAAGTGKTTVLVARFEWLVAQGRGAGVDPRAEPVERRGRRAAAPRSRTRSTARTRSSRSTASASSARACCATRSPRPASIRSSRPATRADRLAVLLDRMDDLHLRRHDIGGRPAVLLAGVIDRIDRLKDELVSAADYAAWARALPADDDAQRDRAAREAEFAQLYLDHDRLLEEEGALDAGELVLRAIAMLRERPASARGSPSATATCSSTSSPTSASRRRCSSSCSPPSTAA